MDVSHLQQQPQNTYDDSNVMNCNFSSLVKLLPSPHLSYLFSPAKSQESEKKDSFRIYTVAQNRLTAKAAGHDRRHNFIHPWPCSFCKMIRTAERLNENYLVFQTKRTLSGATRTSSICVHSNQPTTCVSSWPALWTIFTTTIEYGIQLARLLPQYPQGPCLWLLYAGRLFSLL